MNDVINSCLVGLNNAGRIFCDYAGGMFVQSSVLIVMLLIIGFVLRKRVRATFRYCVWMLVFVKLVLPPTLCLPTGVGYWCGDYLSADSPVLQPVSNIVQPESARTRAPQESALPLETFEPQTSRALPGTVARSASTVSSIEPITWRAVLFLVWLAGVLVISTLLIQRVRFVKWLIAQGNSADGQLLDLLDQCRCKVGVRRNVELRLSSNTSSPAVCGLFKPIILMPTSIVNDLSPDKLRAVFIHELAHIKRGDLWVNVAQTILQIIYFYNPFVWLANAVVRGIREQAVDEMVLVALRAEVKSYSNTLIDIAEMAFWRASFSLRLIGVVESKKALRRRIKHMLNRPIPKTAKIGFVGVLAVIIVGSVLLPMAKGKKNPKLLTGIDEKLKVTDKAGELTIDSLYMPSPNGSSLVGTNKVTLYVNVTNHSPKDIYLGLEYYTDSGTIAKVFSPGATGRAQIKKVPANWQGKLEYPIRYMRFAKGGYVKITLAKCAGEQNTEEKTLAFLPPVAEIIYEKKHNIVPVDDMRSDGAASTDSSFTATLPNGVTVELIGLCKEPVDGAKWWKPDGSDMLEPFFGVSKRTPPLKAMTTQYSFLVKARGSEDISIRMKIYEGFGWSTRVAEDGTALCYIKHPNGAKTYHEDAFSQGPIEVGVAHGQWIKGRGVSSPNMQTPRSYLIGNHDEIVIQPPRPQKSSPETATIFWFTSSSHDYEYRLICTLKDGNIEECMKPFFQSSNKVEAGNLKNSTLNTKSLNIDRPLEQIVNYELLYRKFDYARFNNVAFKPNVKTNVQVDVVGQAGASAKKRKVYLPDLETPDAEVVLDLATSQMLSAERMEKDHQYFEKLGKGDIVYEYASGEASLLCLRGATMQLRTNEGLVSLKPDVQRQYFVGYVLTDVPCQYQITTAEGDKYELKVLSVDQGKTGGAHIEYRKPHVHFAVEDERLGGSKLIEDENVIEGIMPALRLAVDGCLGERPRIPRLREKAGPGILTGIVKDTADTSDHMAYLCFVPVENWPGKPVFYYFITVNESFEITGIPPRSYYLFAIEARNPNSVDTVGLPIDWPRPVTVDADGKVTHVKIEMSTWLSKKVRFWNVQGFLRGLGDVNAQNVFTEELGPYGRVLDARGNPAPYATVQVREFKPNRGRGEGIAAPDARTNEQGYYGLRPLSYPYHLGAIIYTPLTDAVGHRWQYMRRNRVFEGKQEINFEFGPWPSAENGSGTIKGTAVDDNDNPIPSFIVDVRPAGSWPKVKETTEPWYHRWGFRSAFGQGQFALSDVPAGTCNVRVMSHGTSAERNVILGETTITVSAGQTVNLKFKVEDWEKKRQQQNYVTLSHPVATRKSSGSTDAPVED